MAGEDDDTDSIEFDPNVAGEPKSSRAWLAMIEEAEKAFEDWQERCDNIEKVYANLGDLAAGTRDRAFQLFWANVEVLKPSIYAKPPIPVIVPKFKDRRPLYRTAAELLERCSAVAFDLAKIDTIMRLIRDDVCLPGRGVPWVRFETGNKSGRQYYNGEKVCVDHKDRKDFLHGPARSWPEVPWVAAASYLTKKEARKRFSKYSGKAYQDAAYKVWRENKELGASDGRARAKIWELWHKDENKVVWVTEGCEKVLDEDKPHLDLECFFPCPMPAYATLQRGSLMPVPDMLFYKDQLEEINQLTARIHALSDAIRVRGFYPGGAGEIGDAIETALKSADDRRIVVPISSWAAFGGAAPKDTIVWLPIDMIVSTVQSLVELRRLIIDDVYQIMGLSDIMRGSSNPNETLGAQQLKSQYGSVRVRDKQAELVRVARDTLQIVAEVIAENFSKETLLAMSQMDIPTDAQIAKQVAGLEKQAKDIAAKVQEAQSDPMMAQQAQQNPEAAQKMLQQATQQIEALGVQARKLQETPTIEDVMKFLRDERARPFVLDIETDSTIQPDEDAEKKRRGEFMIALGNMLPQLSVMVEKEPGSAEFAGELLKFATTPFRVGRSLEMSIDTFVDQMKQRAGGPQPPSPEQQKAQAEMQAMQAKSMQEQQRHQAEQQAKTAEQQRAQQEQGAKAAALAADEQRKEAQARLVMDQTREKHTQDMQIGALNLEKARLEIERVKTQTDALAISTNAKIDQSNRTTDNAIAASQAKTEAQAEGEAQPIDGEVSGGAKDDIVAQALAAMMAHMAAPKRVVRHPQTNEIIGIEPVMMNGAGEQ